MHASAKQARNSIVHKRSSSTTICISTTKRHCGTSQTSSEDEEGLVYESDSGSRILCTPEMESMDMFPPLSVETKRGSPNDNDEFMHGKLGIISKEITTNLVAFMRQNYRSLSRVAIDNIIAGRQRMNARLKADLSKGWDCASILKVIVTSCGLIRHQLTCASWCWCRYQNYHGRRLIYHLAR